MNKLLSSDPVRIGRPDVAPTSDAVDEERVDGTPEELKTDLIWILGEDLDLSPVLRQTVKSQNSMNGEFDSWVIPDERSRVK